LSMRLATTLGTNALLTRKGAPTALFITEGFGDLLRIGTQQRPDLFALDIRHISCSSDLAPFMRLLPRAETAVVNAYLAPILEAYLARVRGGPGRLHVMTSAGGLVSVE